MTHVRIPDFSQPAPVRGAPVASGRASAASLMPAAEAAFAKHVRARRALRANPTPARIRAAEAAWDGVLDSASAIVSSPIPRSVGDLRCLAVGISMAMEQCLDDTDALDLAQALRALVAGVMMTLDAVPPAGHEGL